MGAVELHGGWGWGCVVFVGGGRVKRGRTILCTSIGQLALVGIKHLVYLGSLWVG